MKKILALIAIAGFACGQTILTVEKISDSDSIVVFPKIATASEVADNTSDIALKANLTLDNLSSAGTNVITDIAGSAGDYVDIADGTATNLTQIGTAKLQVLNASTNSVSRVVTNNVGGYTDGLVLITKVYYGTTNTFYDLTD